jgi:sulfotransferase
MNSNKKYHFISGLPRAGSTLLSSILKQNPRFTAGISDPLQSFTHSIIRDVNSAVGVSSLVNIDKRRDLIRGLFDSYYQECTDVCFNTNRGWTADTPLLQDLFPGFKMIVCVRDVPWILDSFEVLNSKNPYTIKALYNHMDLGSVYERTHMLMGNIPNQPGYVAGPLNNLRQSMFSAEAKQLLYVDYDTLTAEPEMTLRRIYKFIDEPWFSHDFDNVEDSYDEFDEGAKIVGLHTIRKKVEARPRKSVLPDDLWAAYSTSSFWKHDFDHGNRELQWVAINTNQRSSAPRITKQL